jgi:hypothetical protein
VIGARSSASFVGVVGRITVGVGRAVHGSWRAIRKRRRHCIDCIPAQAIERRGDDSGALDLNLDRCGDRL